MKETKKFLIIIGVFCFAILAMLGWLYMQMSKVGYKPFKNADSIYTKMEVLDQQIAELQMKIDQIPAVKEELRKLEADQDEATQLLPKENDPAELLSFITTKADEVKVKPQRINPSRKTAGGGGGRGRGRGGAKQAGKFEQWIYSMNIIGTYDQLATFINRMEEFVITRSDGSREKRFFAVENLNISSEKSGMVEGEAEHTAKITMVTYRYTGGE